QARLHLPGHRHPGRSNHLAPNLIQETAPSRHGSVERYVTGVLGVSPDMIAALRAHLLTEATPAG
ncbi:MAG TPA: hypothetical protein VFV66_10470, partial [Nonomuraea sp.]|nr:hypothetical protein [Nonomuraea sp.]